MAVSGKSKTAPVAVSGSIVCKYCGARIEVTHKPSTVICPKCGMSIRVPKSFKG